MSLQDLSYGKSAVVGFNLVSDIVESEEEDDTKETSLPTKTSLHQLRQVNTK